MKRVVVRYGSPGKQIQVSFPVLLFVTRVEIHMIQTMAAPDHLGTAYGCFPERGAMRVAGAERFLY